MPETEAVNSVVALFARAGADMRTVLIPAALWLLAGVATVDIAVVFGRRLIEGAGLESIVVQLVMKSLVWGVAYELVTNSSFWLRAVTDGFAELGVRVTGGQTELDAGEVLAEGIRLAMLLYDGAYERAWGFSPLGALIAAISSAFVVFAFAAIAAELVLFQVWAEFLLSISPVFLALLVSRGTAGFVQPLFSSLLGVGAAIFTLYVVVGTGQSLFDGQFSSLFAIASRSGAEAEALFTVVGVSFTYLLIAIFLPRLAAGLVNAPPPLTVGSALLVGGALTQLTRSTLSLLTEFGESGSRSFGASAPPPPPPPMSPPAGSASAGREAEPPPARTAEAKPDVARSSTPPSSPGEKSVSAGERRRRTRKAKTDGDGGKGQ